MTAPNLSTSPAVMGSHLSRISAMACASPNQDHSSTSKREPITNGHSSPLKRRSPDDDLPVNGADGQTASATEASPRRSKRARTDGTSNDIKTSSSAAVSPTPVQTTNGDESKGAEQARRSDRKRAEKEQHMKELESCNPPYVGITTEEKRSWKGWCELDSEPAFFNVMLKDLGVNGVKVQEVISLESELLATLPQPVYGLIFLFHFTDEDESDGEQEACPAHVWFANQVAPNACGSYALLNIINNIPNVDFGEEMRDFKEHTKAMTPADRGTAVADCDFIRQIHNTFARTVETQYLDVYLQDDMEIAAKKGKKKAAKKSKKKKAADDDATFHFIAYVPIGGEIWKMDGLDWQPFNLCVSTTANWLDTIVPQLANQMSALQSGGIQFNMLAVVKDPIVESRKQLAANVKLIRAIETRLDSITADWKMFTPEIEDDEYITSASEAAGLTPSMIDQARVSDADEKKLRVDDDINTLIEWRERIINDQAPFRANVRDEMQTALEDEAKAQDRRNDYGPVIQAWLNELAENEVLRELADEVMKPVKTK